MVHCRFAHQVWTPIPMPNAQNVQSASEKAAPVTWKFSKRISGGPSAVLEIKMIAHVTVDRTTAATAEAIALTAWPAWRCPSLAGSLAEPARNPQQARPPRRSAPRMIAAQSGQGDEELCAGDWNGVINSPAVTSRLP